MALRCAVVAVAVPSVVFAGWLALGQSTVAASGGGSGRPVFAAIMATFVLVPMLALTAAAAATFAVAAIARAHWSVRRRALRATFLASAAVWALLAAYWHVALIVPAVTR